MWELGLAPQGMNTRQSLKGADNLVYFKSGIGVKKEKAVHFRGLNFNSMFPYVKLHSYSCRW